MERNLVDDFYAYVIMTAMGLGTYPAKSEGLPDDWDWPGHGEVIRCLPDVCRNIFTKTEENEDDSTWGASEQFPTTKWVASMNQEQWEAFREHMCLEPERLDETMGMITEYGHMWALCDNADGTDWNMGGVTPVSWVDTYFCCQDADMMERAGVEITAD
jgi:hypothetical protein